MTEVQNDIVAILVKYALHEPLTGPEELTLASWRQRSAEHAVLPEQFRDKRWLDEQRKLMHRPPTEAMWADIRRHIEGADASAPLVDLQPSRRIRWGRFAAAAVFLVAMVYGGMRISRRSARPAGLASSIKAVVPGRYQALLTLDDGNAVVLDTLRKRSIIVQGSIWLEKTDSNTYVYGMRASAEPGVLHRLVLAPGAGGIQLQWPDGSNAWIRGGTALSYAVDLRSAPVTIDGEAWFRLEHDPERPTTIALSGGGLVRVLGTSFDVRSHAGDSANRVALFSGRVRVVKGVDSLELQPGWQAITGGPGIVAGKIDSGSATAWIPASGQSKYRDLHEVNLLEMMPTIAMWYNVTVINPERVAGNKISAGFFRTTPLTEIINNLQSMEASAARIRLRNDTIFISPLKPGIQRPSD